MHFTSIWILFTYCATVVWSTGCSWHCPAIQVRKPFQKLASYPTNSTWTPPPLAWYYGNWQVRYSTRKAYQSLYNFQADTYPTLPTNTSIPKGRNIDLTSFNFPPSGNKSADAIVHTAFGYDYPVVDATPPSFTFHGSGLLASTTNSWTMLAWGYDVHGVEWRAEYETAYGSGSTYGEPCINVLSRVVTGPDSKTFHQVLDSLRAAFKDDQALAPYTKNITELPRDKRRAGQPPVSCDVACMMNK